MSEYDDGRGYMIPLTEDKAHQFADGYDLRQVGYEEETDSYGPIYFVDEKMEDPGIRFQYAPYPTLEGPIAKKSKRVACVWITTDGVLKVKASGMYVNVTRSGEVYVHWPSSRFGHDNHLEWVFANRRIAMAPLIVLGFFQWIRENAMAKPVNDWMEVNVASQTGREAQ